MAKRPIVIWPDPVLTRPTQPVAEVTEETRALVRDMFETMYDASGIGLAANQIGVEQQVLVIDLDPTKQAAKDKELREELDAWLYKEPVVLINPKITHAEGKITWEEGCLSLPGITEDITRKSKITVEGLDAMGTKQIMKAEGLFAVCIQHEMDHLAGKIFVDYLSKLKRDVIRRKMQKIRGGEETNTKREGV